MVMVPPRHIVTTETGNYRLSLRRVGLFKRKEILVLQSEWNVCVYSPYGRGGPYRTYTIWEDSEIFNKLPYNVVRYNR